MTVTLKTSKPTYTKLSWIESAKIGNQIAKLRKTNHLTQKQVGAMIGVTGNVICTWEKELCRIKGEYAKKVYAVLGQLEYDGKAL